MHSLRPSATDIQSHLYTSFLQASTYDVSIHVAGSWNAIYKLHRVVLIQSGFFRSLFTAGFSEASIRPNNIRDGSDDIKVVFDDYNITRPAFELCISRLYGGGPPLYLSPNLVPTTNYPLTPPYSGICEPEEVPLGNHPATPRFLLSLLATAIYLSIPTIASQALSLILKTIGPSTVIQYLDFACGKYIRHSPLDPPTAVGLEHVAQVLDVEVQSTSGSQRQKANNLSESYNPVTDCESQKDQSSNPLPKSSDSDSSDGEYDDLGDDGPSHHYGAVSDKIGEACACWLARWAVDMLRYEEQKSGRRGSDCMSSRMRSRSMFGLGETKISITGAETPAISQTPFPIIWSRGGLSAHWVSALVSADTLFVKNERERYNFARSVVELRRRCGVLDEEERIWTAMFEHGIYYINMAFEDIQLISQDVSPTTRRFFVPPSVLQASHWTQSVLRHQITSKQSSPTPYTVGTGVSSPPRDKDLGIILTTADILAKVSERTQTELVDLERSKSYFPVLRDSSLRIGDNGNSAYTTATGTPLSMEELFTSSHSPSSGASPSAGKEAATTNTPDTAVFKTSEDVFFGLMTPRYAAPSCVERDPTGKSRWSPYPPYRFSVEFWDVDMLKEKSRLHSHTVWYAGSLFNVYVQLVRKKSQAQLGIYLHRQSNVDPIPAASAPSVISQVHADRDLLASSLSRSSHVRQASLPLTQLHSRPSQSTIHYSPSIHPHLPSATLAANIHHARPGSPPSLSSSPQSLSSFGLGTFPSTSTSLTPPQPYRDPRSSISAYFAVSCASATGSSQTRFSSAPDVFSVSQSWGWKSSSLRTEEFVEVGTQPLPGNVIRGQEVSLRATVLLGLV
ncbi:hypothetical protein B0H34DRAFT_646000 [Crassisporium funariophilum]|nr:hypothetical protein B0H34DRAFT_646000 [Crassisporium funariophilum]